MVKKIDKVLFDIDIKDGVIVFKSKSNNVFKDYNNIINKISPNCFQLKNNIDLKVDDDMKKLSNETPKFRIYRSRSIINRIRFKNSTQSLKVVKTTQNSSLEEILKMKEAFDETKQRLDQALDNSNEGFYNNLIKLSDKLDKIIDKSIKL